MGNRQKFIVRQVCKATDQAYFFGCHRCSIDVSLRKQSFPLSRLAWSFRNHTCEFSGNAVTKVSSGISEIKKWCCCKEGPLKSFRTKIFIFWCEKHPSQAMHQQVYLYLSKFSFQCFSQELQESEIQLYLKFFDIITPILLVILP